MTSSTSLEEHKVVPNVRYRKVEWSASCHRERRKIVFLMKGDKNSCVKNEKRARERSSNPSSFLTSQLANQCEVGGNIRSLASGCYRNIFSVWTEALDEARLNIPGTYCISVPNRPMKLIIFHLVVVFDKGQQSPSKLDQKMCSFSGYYVIY